MSSLAEIQNTINSIIEKTQNDSFFDNKCYQIWEERPLTLEEAEIFLANYFARTINTVARVTDVISALLNEHIMLLQNSEFAKSVVANLANLQDELGNGDSSKLHPLLMAEWINLLLRKLGSENIPIEIHYHKFVTDETKMFINRQKDLYSSKSLAYVLGASFSQELTADFMMKKLHKGYVKNYRSLFSSEREFAKTNLYFELHIDGTEENHHKLATEVIYSYCTKRQQIDDLISSFNEFQRITCVFWNGILSNLS
jgi:hypothetical protein